MSAWASSFCGNVVSADDVTPSCDRITKPADREDGDEENQDAVVDEEREEASSREFALLRHGPTLDHERGAVSWSGAGVTLVCSESRAVEPGGRAARVRMETPVTKGLTKAVG